MNPLGSKEAYQRAQKLRDEIAQHAIQVGVTEEKIGALVEDFYGRIVHHPSLGSIFRREIDGRWPEHLEKMKRFWTSMILRTTDFKGNTLKVHLALPDIDPDMLPEWLTLWKTTVADHFSNQEAADLFLRKAESIAERIRNAIKDSSGAPES